MTENVTPTLFQHRISTKHKTHDSQVGFTSFKCNPPLVLHPFPSLQSFIYATWFHVFQDSESPDSAPENTTGERHRQNSSAQSPSSSPFGLAPTAGTNQFSSRKPGSTFLAKHDSPLLPPVPQTSPSPSETRRQRAYGERSTTMSSLSNTSESPDGNDDGHRLIIRVSNSLLRVRLHINRLNQACDMCRKKKIRCEPTGATCVQCIKYRTICHFTPISVKRKPRRPLE